MKENEFFIAAYLAALTGTVPETNGCKDAYMTSAGIANSAFDIASQSTDLLIGIGGILEVNNDPS